jgi:DNA topoisomerase-2
MSTDSFRDKLDTWKETKEISGYKNYSSVNTVNFVITESADGFACNMENLKLSSFLSVSNMVAFTEDGIRKFNSVYEIIDYFCTKRVEFYVKRKINLLNKIEEEITLLGNKRRFMESVISSDIKVFKQEGKKKVARPITELTEELEEKKFDKIFKKKKNDDGDEPDGDEKGEETEETPDKNSENGYGYLLSMQFRSITEERLRKIKDELASKIQRKEEIETKSEKEMYLTDLNDFESRYTDFLQTVEKEKTKGKIKRKKKA